jgi:hypothetical protein
MCEAEGYIGLGLVSHSRVGNSNRERGPEVRVSRNQERLRLWRWKPSRTGLQFSSFIILIYCRKLQSFAATWFIV